jgi:hypothetical protein
VHEDNIDDVDGMILPKKKDYREQLMKYEDRDPGSITILNIQSNEGALHLCEDVWKSIAMIKSHLPTLYQEKKTQDGKGMIDLEPRVEYFQRGTLVLMWDKRRGKPNMCKEFDSLWHGPYKIEKKYGINSFYLNTYEGTRLPLPINGSLLKHYYVEGT